MIFHRSKNLAHCGSGIDWFFGIYATVAAISLLAGVIILVGLLVSLIGFYK